MSATNTNPDWYESNRPRSDPDPQWHRDILERVNISIPEYIFNRRRAASDSDFSDTFSESESESEPGVPSKPFRAEAAREVPVPEIFIHTARLWGLTMSPGGGVTAALVSYHPAQALEHGGFHRNRSRVAFDFVPLDNGNDEGSESDSAPEGIMGDPIDGRVSARPLSTEARMWEWMYGGGAGVKNLSAAAVRHETTDDAVRSMVRKLFSSIVGTQKCTICEAGLEVEPNGDFLCKGAEWKHEYGEHTPALPPSCPILAQLTMAPDVCSASGLAILEPFTSRSCGVCGKETLKVEELRKYLPADKASKIPENVIGAVCGRCGGKYIN